MRGLRDLMRTSKGHVTSEGDNLVDRVHDGRLGTDRSAHDIVCICQIDNDNLLGAASLIGIRERKREKSALGSEGLRAGEDRQGTRQEHEHAPHLGHR